MDTSLRHALARRSSRHALTRYLHAGQCERVWCFTDPGRLWLAQAFAEESAGMGLEPHVEVLSGEAGCEPGMARLRGILAGLGVRDMVLSVFSWGTEKSVPYFRVLPNLGSPEGFPGISASIRQRYPDDALLAHLMTDPDSIETTLGERLALNAARRVRVTTPAGTDISFDIAQGKVLPYRISGGNRHAFLPPSEISFGIAAGSADGEIVVDVTAGEFVVEGEVRDMLGLIDHPVHVTVVDGHVAAIAGGDIAHRLDKCFAGLGPNSRLLVELGFGLSQGTPTGLVGPDECLQGTCHFGIGDDSFYGKVNPAPVHLDVVCDKPAVLPL